MFLKVLQKKIDRSHNCSFWYNGIIAESENFRLVVNGEPEIYDSLLEETCTEKFKCDNDLPSTIKFSMSRYEWIEKCYFELIDLRTDDTIDVFLLYDEALKGISEQIRKT